jgi:hypothetical protein
MLIITIINVDFLNYTVIVCIAVVAVRKSNLLRTLWALDVGGHNMVLIRVKNSGALTQEK